MREWHDIATAPRDRRVRIKDDEGSVRKMVFKAPHWWDVGDGQLRILDNALYKGDEDILRAVAWQEAA
ncbi:hypothetical protein HGP14_09565 [Rhizobium sp. P32RR-XVIII]|uniref:hypothetical protein n=1 Tax=Rhizobium sp. P32RR-XVIII TaxID=2726738 RepID=UPI001456F60F|nr:hypothetical protein [Rhizobium sp. P32RR-XVIII]NLS03605.1 hypothetical protein [Rhizobium sp. P32RR-XVIII]